MADFYGVICISNNLAEYDQEMMQYVYAFKYAGPQQKLDMFDYSDNKCLKLVCNEEFRRGDLLKIIITDEKSLFTDKVRNQDKTQSLSSLMKQYPGLLFLSMRIGVAEDACFELTPSKGVDIVLSNEVINKGSKFYGCIVLVHCNDPTIKQFKVSAYDKNTLTRFEWVIERSVNGLKVT